MTTQEKQNIQKLVGELANKNYSGAQTALQDTVTEKIKNKIRDYVSKKN